MLLSLGARTSAQTAATSPDSALRITLVTFGSGEEVFERFGHNALWVHDAARGIDVAYDWGNFSFRQPRFLERFLTGDTRYWMEGKEAIPMLDFYRRIGRPITLQRLALTPGQAAALRDFLLWNARPENMFYRYDYFVDNCSTRLRDALDHVLGGALRAATDTIRTPFTYRRESVRLTAMMRMPTRSAASTSPTGSNRQTSRGAVAASSTTGAPG
jgi:hypothetical protein